uniref:Uncharacterized protein n=1 Tax=Panagrolaimus sp. ES5 TaxID=591445 RepID=A0AC34GDZ8_9BILA
MYGAKKTLEVIIQIQKLFPPGARHFSRSQLLPFFESLFNHKDTDFISALRVCHELIDIDLVPDRKVFLEVAAKYLIEKLPYDEAFYKWSNACSMDNIVSGGNIFLEYVLSDKKIAIKLQEKRINQLVKLYEQVLTPNDLIAQLIVSLVSTGRLADAKVLWLKLDVHCKHFLSPLHNLGSDKFVDVDLVHIRDFAHLFEKCVLAEFKSKKRLKKKKVVASGEESSEDLPDGEETVKLEPIPDGDMAFLIKRWQPYKKRKYGKPQKIKKFEVKADQLEALVNTIQEVWFRLIKLKNDPKVVGVEELEQFLKRNNIPFSEKIHE